VLYVLIFFSVTSKYSEDEPIIYKLSEFKKTQVMKNQHVLLKIKETKYCSVHCHALEPNNFMTILNSKAQGDTILAEHIATM
jgi:biopolymer transport protein ExbD